MEKEKTQSKGLTVLKKIINIIINVMIVIVLITSLLIAVMALTSKANGISTIFGYTIQTIQSDSMKGGSPDGYEGGDFEHGDLMIAKATGNDQYAEYDLGDIVTFSELDSAGQKVFIVHRIVDKYKDDSGNYRYQTWGDNREMSQSPDQLSKDYYLVPEAFCSVFYSDNYEGKIIKGAGAFLDYLRSQQGFFLVVLLPMILFFMYELIRVVLNYGSYRKAKTDEEKQKAVDEALANNSGLKLEDMTPEQMEQFKKFLEQQKQAEDK